MFKTTFVRIYVAQRINIDIKKLTSYRQEPNIVIVTRARTNPLRIQRSQKKIKRMEIMQSIRNSKKCHL